MCDLAGYGIKSLPNEGKSKGASFSDIWKLQQMVGGKLTGMYIKIFKKGQLGLEYEASVYEHLKALKSEDGLLSEKFYKDRFIDMICYKPDVEFEELSALVTDQKTVKNILEVASLPRRLANKLNISKRTVTNITYSAIITDTPADTVILFDFLYREDIELEQKLLVLYQLVLLIEKLGEIGISHNDMHWGNVLVAYDPVGFRLRSAKAEFRPILFDWDRAQMKEGETNPFLTDEVQLYESPFSKTRDYAIFLYQYIEFCRIYLNKNNNETKSYPDKIIPDFVIPTMDVPEQFIDKVADLLGRCMVSNGMEELLQCEQYFNFGKTPPSFEWVLKSIDNQIMGILIEKNEYRSEF